MALLESMVEQIFTKQFKYSNGRHSFQSAFSSPHRMQWHSSEHLAITFHEMNKLFGEKFHVLDYCCSKLYGHMYCPAAVGQFTNVDKFIIPMLAMMAKRCGWGDIKAVVTDYKKGQYKFEFKDCSVAREIYKLYGKQKMPVCSMAAGLVAGNMEHLLKKKFIAIETECIAMGKKSCSFTVLPPEKAEIFVKKLKGVYKASASRILQAEKKHDFLKEAEKLMKGLDKCAIAAESKFLKG
jgi:predicted hydrocarbon binding protein